MRIRGIQGIGLLCCVVCCVISMAGVVHAADHYVSPLGSNGSLGDEGNPWRTLNYAVYSAGVGDTIWVMDDGNASTDDYDENVVVDKSVTIAAYDDDGTRPQVHATNAYTPGISIEADNVMLIGLDVYGATSDYGIVAAKFSGMSSYPLYNIVVTNCRAGWDETHYNETGIYFHRVNGGRINGCTASYNYNLDGILVMNMSTEIASLEIVDNTVSHNHGHGIYLDQVKESLFRNNTVEWNYAEGFYVYNSDSNQFANNLVRYTEIKSGIKLLNGSDDNTFVDNNSTAHPDYGVELNNSSGNRFYRNELYGIVGTVGSTNSSSNMWVSPTAEDYMYGGVVYTSVLGNRYGDYAGSDADGDGIGDSVYDFADPETQDDYPLQYSLNNYEFGVVMVNSFDAGDFSGWTSVVTGS